MCLTTNSLASLMIFLSNSDAILRFNKTSFLLLYPTVRVWILSTWGDKIVGRWSWDLPNVIIWGTSNCYRNRRRLKNIYNKITTILWIFLVLRYLRTITTPFVYQFVEATSSFIKTSNISFKYSTRRSIERLVLTILYTVRYTNACKSTYAHISLMLYVYKDSNFLVFAKYVIKDTRPWERLG